MAELTMTSQERERVDLFIREQRTEWERNEEQKMHLAALKGEEYTPQDFPGYNEQEALNAVRAGWKSKLDMMFEKKRKREGW